MSTNYLSILGLNSGASEDEIKKAYKKLALKYHPDRNKEKGAADEFKKISEAYQILTGKSQPSNSHNFGFMNPNDLFAQFFNMNSGMNTHFVNITPRGFSGMQSRMPCNVTHINIGGIPTNSTSRSSSIQIINGKKIETVIETRNGTVRKRTIVTDL